MIIQCHNCGKRFRVDPEMLLPAGKKLRCAECRTVFFQPPIPPHMDDETELAAILGGEETAPPFAAVSPTPPVSGTAIRTLVARPMSPSASLIVSPPPPPPASPLSGLSFGSTPAPAPIPAMIFTDFEQQYRITDLSMRQRAEIIDKTKWSSDFEWDDIEILAHFLVAYKVPKGTILFRQGDVRRFMTLIIKGEIEILKEDSKKQNRALTIIGPEKTLGEMAMVDGHPRSATAIASKETMFFLLGYEKFLQLAEEYPRVWGRLLLKIANLMSQRLRLTSGELVDHISQQ